MNLNPWDQAKLQLNEATKTLKLSPKLLKRLLNHHKILQVDVPVTMDNGEKKTFKGFRIQHNNIRGPYKGGLRYHPDVSLEEIKALSVLPSASTLNDLAQALSSLGATPRELVGILAQLQRTGAPYADILPN